MNDAINTFASQGNPPRSVNIKGEGVKNKSQTLFGCAPANDAPTGGVGFGDLAVAALALLSLIVTSRIAYRFRTQS